MLFFVFWPKNFSCFFTELSTFDILSINIFGPCFIGFNLSLIFSSILTNLVIKDNYLFSTASLKSLSVIFSSIEVITFLNVL